MGTVRGAVAGGWDPNAFNLRVSSEVCRTDTLLLVADNVAEGIEPAGSLFAARVSALALVTHLIHLAVAVLCAGSCGMKWVINVAPISKFQFVAVVLNPY